jgi:hypothetical protein
MTLEEFFNKHNGKYVEFDNRYPFQCKDLFSFYNRDVVGNPDYVYGDAWQLYTAFPSKYYRVTTETPQKGDIAVWKKEFGGYGHVAIVWDDGKFFSQNYPLKTKCSLQTIPTTKLQGYLRPRLFDNQGTIMWNDLINYNKGIARYFAGLPDGKEPTVLKVSVKYPEGGKLALVKKFGDGDYRIRIGVSEFEFLNSGVGDVVPITPEKASKLKQF